MTPQERAYNRALVDIDERIREVRDLILDAQEAMLKKRPVDAWSHLNDAKTQIDAALVSAKWSQTLVEET